MRQLFYNLNDDSLKHGEKVSQIRVYYEVGKNQLKLIYEDDEIGIPENEKEKNFPGKLCKGTGYGLALIKPVCETYGWTIQKTGIAGSARKGPIYIIPQAHESKKNLMKFGDL